MKTSEEIMDLTEDRIFALLRGESTESIIKEQNLSPEDEERVVVSMMMCNVFIDWDDDYVA